MASSSIQDSSSKQEMDKSTMPLLNPTQTSAVEYVVHVKSRKEMRAERKAQKKQENTNNAANETDKEVKPLTKEEKKALRKEQKKLQLKEERLRLMKEQREAKKKRKQKRMHIEMNAPGGIECATEKKAKRQKIKENTSSVTENEEESAMNVYRSLFNGSQDDATGMTTMRMDVQYKDIVMGKGPAVEDLTLLTVSYKLKGGKFGAVIDSSKKFTFRVGKGEVIKGWDIGLIGMQVGGKRELIVPPKAGYGSQDIGAGPGAMLFFEITLLSIR
jgi:FKBP-type peptidyl-prolyl cis-trans isomerase